MTDDYTSERVIGHHIGASLETRELFTGTELERVRITEGDVDWQDTHTVRLSLDELTDLYHEFVDTDPLERIERGLRLAERYLDADDDMTDNARKRIEAERERLAEYRRGER